MIRYILILLCLGTTISSLGQTSEEKEAVILQYKEVPNLFASYIKGMEKYNGHLFISDMFNKMLVYDINTHDTEYVSFYRDEGYDMSHSEIIRKDNLLFHASQTGYLTCMDLNTLTIKWQFYTGETIQSSFTLYKDNIYCNNSKAKVFVVDIYTGKGKEISLQSYYPVGIYGDKIIAESYDGVTINDLNTLEQKEEYLLDGRTMFKNTNNMLVICTAFKTVFYDLDKMQFHTKEFRGRGTLLNMEPYIYDDIVVFSLGEDITIYDFKTEEVNYINFEKDYYWTAATLYKDQYIYALYKGRVGAKIVSVNPFTRRVNWTCEVGNNLSVNYIKVIDDQVFFTVDKVEDERVYTIDLKY